MRRRRRRAKRCGCSVRRRANGKLGFRFRLEQPDGSVRQFSEGTKLLDTPENWELMRKQAAVIGAEIEARTFSYEKWFPDSSVRKLLGSRRDEPRNGGGGPTVAERYAEWIEGEKAPVVRPSLEREYRSHFKHHILPELGDAPLRGLAKRDLERLRAALRGKKVSEKTVRNVIDGTFRAFFRDAAQEIDGLPYPYPFSLLRWAAYVPPEPNPFSPEERDQLLDFYRLKKWKVGGFNEKRSHYPYYAYLFTLFFTGARPSELAAARVASLDLRAGTLRIRASRHRGVESAPKTRSADRVVRLTPRNVEVLRPVVELRARPDDHLFKNPWGEPIKPENFYDAFVNTQKTLGIRVRDLYATKDTYISNALTQGANLTWLSEQTGVAEATLRKHYGRFVHSTARDALEQAKIDPESFRAGMPRSKTLPSSRATLERRTTATRRPVATPGVTRKDRDGPNALGA